MALPSSRVVPLSVCPALSDPGGVLLARHYAFRTAAFRFANNVGFSRFPFPVILCPLPYTISGFNHTACVLVPPSFVLPLLVLHVGFSTDLLARL
jgi:hypothetical protein